MKKILDFPQITLKGSPKQMGAQLGEMYRLQIQELCDIHYHWMTIIIQQTGRIYSNEALAKIMAQCLEYMKKFSPLMYEEFCATARAANTSPESLSLIYMSDIIDILAFSGTWHQFGCSSIVVCADSTVEKKLLLGQTWDWLTDDLPYFYLIHRKPDKGIENWSLGVLFGYTLGMNIYGITIGLTNLMTWDSQVGLFKGALVANVLNSKTIQQSINSITQASRASAHYYYLGDKHGTAYGIETSATKHQIYSYQNGIHAHCNHALDKEIKKYEHCSPDPSTLFRQQRLKELAQNNKPISISHLKTFFADTEGDQHGIRQENTLGIYSTDACVIFSPQTLEIHACLGCADIGKWHTIKLS